MAGRRPGPSRAEVADDAGVPEWVLTSHRITVVIRDLHEQGLLYNIDDVHRERRRRQEAAAAWCAARRLSYCKTVLGWRNAAPDEVARGQILGPEDLST